MSEPKKVRSNVDRLRRQLLAGAGALSLYGAGVLTGKAFADTQNVYIEPKSFSGPYSYLVETDGTYVWAKDGKTGQVAFGGPNNAGGVSGTDAASIIQQAINALPNGGKIFVKAGTYTISSTINVNTANSIVIIGEGWSTILKLANNANVTMFNITKDFCGFKDILLDGNISYVTGDIDIISLTGNHCYFERVYVKSARRYGFNISGSDMVWILNSEVNFCGGYGIYVNNGIEVWLINSHIRSNGGLAPVGAIGGLKLDGSSYLCAVLFNTFDYNRQNVNSVWYGYGFEEASTAHDNRFIGNAGLGNPQGLCNLLGTNRVFKNNIYRSSGLSGEPPTGVFENGGTATFSGNGIATQFTIPHGLSGTPTSVSVTPASNDAKGSFYVTVDATNIYVNYATAPPSGTNNVVLYWSASI